MSPAKKGYTDQHGTYGMPCRTTISGSGYCQLHITQRSMHCPPSLSCNLPYTGVSSFSYVVNCRAGPPKSHTITLFIRYLAASGLL